VALADPPGTAPSSSTKATTTKNRSRFPIGLPLLRGVLDSDVAACGNLSSSVWPGQALLASAGETFRRPGPPRK
jgi:hypothetical protein